mmetsp:Transcript_15938/g.50022  ORF Transcript_15938/g.50022 Transcript_15938/m.50022 type:complete len:212 (+) Transcript_15938:1521-2156(+)
MTEDASRLPFLWSIVFASASAFNQHLPNDLTTSEGSRPGERSDMAHTAASRCLMTSASARGRSSLDSQEAFARATLRAASPRPHPQSPGDSPLQHRACRQQWHRSHCHISSSLELALQAFKPQRHQTTQSGNVARLAQAVGGSTTGFLRLLLIAVGFTTGSSSSSSSTVVVVVVLVVAHSRRGRRSCNISACARLASSPVKTVLRTFAPGL